MSKYEEFVSFMDNLQNNKAGLIAKLSDAEDRVTTFSRELDNAKVMTDTCIGKLAQLKEQLKESPTDVTLGAENAIWITRLKEYGERQDMLSVGLKAAQENYDALILQNRDMDYVPLAEAATSEMNILVTRLYKELCARVVAAVEARKVYLEAISEVNNVIRAGRNAVEAGVKSQSYAKIAKIGNTKEVFAVNNRQFLVSDGDVSKA